MKERKKPIALFLSMLMVFTLLFSVETPVSSARKKVIKLKKIVLNYSAYKLQKGKTLKLKASFKPKKTTQKKITWKSSKKKVASVSKKGVVKALKPGKTTITAKVKGTKKKAVCKIQVVLNSGGSENSGSQPLSITPGPDGVVPTQEPPKSSQAASKPSPSSSADTGTKPDQTQAPSKNPIVETFPPTKTPILETVPPVKTPAPTKAPGTKTAAPVKTPAPTKAPGTKTAAPVKTSAPTKAPGTKTAAPVKTPAPTKVPGTKTAAPVKTSAPTKVPAITPKPKYERPAETAPPVNPVILTAEGAFENEMASGANVVKNTDGSLTVTFSKQYAALNFYLPDNAQNYYSNYKSVALTYTSTGGNLCHALYDTTIYDTSEPADGKHPDYGGAISESGEEKTVVFSVTNDCKGGYIRGLQIFNLNEMKDGKTVTITIKSIIFCDKENPTAEDLKPPVMTTPAPVITAAPSLPPLITREPGPYGITGPVTQGNDIVWDSVTFGSYYQSLYEPVSPPASPAEGAEYTDSDGTQMIYTGGTYYKKEPVTWRVLSADGDDAFLLADQILDTKAFTDQYCSATSWEESSIRQWLNGEFYEKAFTGQEKSTILSQDLSAQGSTAASGTAVAAAASDSVYLPSADEIVQMDYGFAIYHDTYSPTRQAKNTAYARAKGAWTNEESDTAGNGWWWLRTSGSLPFDIAYAGSEGFVDRTGFIAVNTGGGIRPALHINLTSSSWNPAGKITTSSAAELLPTPVPTENPRKKVTLSGVQIDPKIGFYDIDTDSIHINDTQTGNGDTTFMYFPLPLTVKSGDTLRVTVSGPSWGTDKFRIWTTPADATGSGDFVHNANISLNPSVSAGSPYTVSVDLTAKDRDCNCITIKAGYGVKIKDLIISEIVVERVEAEKPPADAGGT